MSITDLEKDLKFQSPASSDSNFGHRVSTKFIGAEETVNTMNVLTKYDPHILEYVKFCMTKYHHEVFLVICERRAKYVDSYRKKQPQHNAALKKGTAKTSANAKSTPFMKVVKIMTKATLTMITKTTTTITMKSQS